MKVILPVLIAISLLLTTTAKAQVGVGTTTPNNSAQLDVSSTTRGMLVPRMSAANRIAITTPATGLLVYDTDSSAFLYYTGSAWLKLLNSTYSGADNLGNHTATQNLNLSGKLLTGNATNYGLWMGDNGLMVDTAAFGSGTALAVAGAGTRMFWYPKKAAFRAGNINGTQWNDASIGNYSVAMGTNVSASGTNAVSFGSLNSASGAGGFAAGASNNVTATNAAAFGQQNTASGYAATALGLVNTASGQGALVVGNGSTASGFYSFAQGTNVGATGTHSVAMGTKVSTNSLAGSFILGDTTTTIAFNDAANQMMMRFKGGYKLYADTTLINGVQITPFTGVLKYFNNVAANYDSRSLTDKNYVDSSLLTITPTAWNNWTTVATGPGSVTYTVGTTGRYRTVGSNQTWFQLALDVTAIADNGYIDLTLPGTPAHNNAFTVAVFQAGIPLSAVAFSSSNKVRVQPTSEAIFGAGNTYTIQVNGFYEQ